MSTQPRSYPDKPDKIYLFGTCLVDTLYPSAGLDSMRLIAREGVQVIYPDDQTCCGQPAWNSGYREEARAVARQQMRCFPRNYPIVVPSGSCAGMMRHHYPELFQGEPEEQTVSAFSERVYELSEFLVHVLKIDPEDRGDPTRVTLHVSCAARREMGVADDHRRLLEQLQNVQIEEQERASECCGFGGTFAVKHPAISAAMVEEKTASILATAPQKLISGDCGCLMNISGHLKHINNPLRSQHLASFLWERTHAADE